MVRMVGEYSEGYPLESQDGLSPSLAANPMSDRIPAVMPEQSVRRLTPRECERLMGWPDDWTRSTTWKPRQARR